MQELTWLFLCWTALSQLCLAQASALSPQVKEFVAVDAPVVALTRVRVIDGRGTPPRPEQTILIEGGSIKALGPAASVLVPAGAKVLELPGHSVFPGLVGMHEHLFYTAAIEQGLPVVKPMSWSFPRLYLGAGVTTIRTTGSIAPDTDINLKQRIDAGQSPGPKIHLTSAYLEGPEGLLELSLHRAPEEVARTVDYWSSRGARWFKAYIHLTTTQLGAAVDAAHTRGARVTGHLCSVTFREAATLGIDNLEHGFAVATEFIPGKKPDVCPRGGFEGLKSVAVDGEPAQELIRLLVARKVAITSTLPVFEQFVSGRPALETRVLDVLAPQSRTSCQAQRAALERDADNDFHIVFRKEMELERAFVKAGGLLVAGSDPTGNGCVVAGFGTQRGVELLVEAGFSPLEAIQIATFNGATLLGEADRIGSIEAGKQADLVVVRGDPSVEIRDIENVVMVFKDGVGYDPKKLVDSAQGIVGFR
ncbi:MAG: amidohydrolase family protein [Acidobacteria bacterium]|nr:amidohydrolase family protein [Acidobacteriota bacterium]